MAIYAFTVAFKPTVTPSRVKFLKIKVTDKYTKSYDSLLRPHFFVSVKEKETIDAQHLSQNVNTSQKVCSRKVVYGITPERDIVKI